jgi:hypothetical protein
MLSEVHDKRAEGTSVNCQPSKMYTETMEFNLQPSYLALPQVVTLLIGMLCTIFLLTRKMRRYGRESSARSENLLSSTY